MDKTDYVIDDVNVNVNVNRGATEIFLMHLIVGQISLGLAFNVPEQVIHYIKEHDVVPRVAYGN